MLYGKVEQQTACNQARTSFGRAENEKGLHAEHVGLLVEFLGWLMGLEPTTTGITILDSTN